MSRRMADSIEQLGALIKD